MRLTVLLVVGLALTPSTARAAGPVCALLDPEKVPQVALLEAKLLADGSAAWVERAGIEKVLREQKLQAMFSPQGVGERVRLGKLLKADVLVMVRSVKGAEKPTLEVVVSETAGGLRLLVRGVLLTKDTGADVGKLLEAAQDGLRKHGEQVAEVVAVPPFVSRNLESNQDHLKSAFAKLAEAEALGREGVVVVELEEAQAMAKELALAAPGSKLARPAPVYLLGEYRHEGRGKDQTLAVKLRAERSGKVVGKDQTLTGKPGDAPKAIREWSAGVLDGLAKDDKPRPPADPKAEAAQLVARSEEFRRLGEWSEAAGLIEGALLLDPARVELHAVMMVIAAIQFDEYEGSSTLRATMVKPAMLAFTRGLEHLAAFVYKGGDLTRHGPATENDLTRWFVRLNKPLSIHPVYPPEARALIEEVTRAQKEVFLPLIPIVAKQGKGAEVGLMRGAMLYLPVREQYAFVEKTIRQLNHLPDPVERGYRYATLVPPMNKFGENTPEFRAFVGQLLGDRDETMRAIGERLKKRLLRDTPDPLIPRPKVPGIDPTAPRYVSLKPIPFAFEPEVKERDRTIHSLVAAGPNVDVLLAGGALFVMKQKGHLKRVGGPNANAIGAIHFDGRYVWASGRRTVGNPTLFVLDPKSEKVWEVTREHGMPGLTPEQIEKNTADSHLVAAPLGEGRACLAGHFSGRGWVGVATFDPVVGPSVKVTLEAKVVAGGGDKDPVGLEGSFVPSFLVPLPGQPDPANRATQRVLLGRRGNTLSLDPNRPENGPLLVGNILSHVTSDDLAIASDGALYYTEDTFFGDKRVSRITRVPLATGKRELTNAHVPRGRSCMLFHDGRINIVVNRQWIEQEKLGVSGKGTDRWEWWQYDPATQKSRLLADNLPPVHQLVVSSHYGLVAINHAWGEHKAGFNAAVIEDPGAKYDYNPIQSTSPKPGDAAELKQLWASSVDAGRAVAQIHFMPDAGLIVYAGVSGETSMFGAVDAKTGEAKSALFADPPKKVVQFYPLGPTRFATRSFNESRVRIWDAKTGKSEGEIAIPEVPEPKSPEPKSPQYTYAYAQLSPDGKYLVSARTGRPGAPVSCAFRLVDVKTGKAILSFDWTGGLAHFTSDSSRVLVAEYGGRFRWFKLPGGEVDGSWEFTEPGGTAGVHHRVMGVSDDGSVIAYHGSRTTRSASVFTPLNGKNGDALRRFVPVYMPFGGKVLSEDGRSLALFRPTAPGRMTFEIFPTTEGPAVAQVTVPFERSMPMGYLSPDGRMLIIHESGTGKLSAYEVPDTRPATPPK